MSITLILRTHNPHPTHGVVRDEHGVVHYDNLPESLTAMLREWVERMPRRSSSWAESG